MSDDFDTEVVCAYPVSLTTGWVIGSTVVTPSMRNLRSLLSDKHLLEYSVQPLP